MAGETGIVASYTVGGAHRPIVQVSFIAFTGPVDESASGGVSTLSAVRRGALAELTPVVALCTVIGIYLAGVKVSGGALAMALRRPGGLRARAGKTSLGEVELAITHFIFSIEESLTALLASCILVIGGTISSIV